MFYTYRQAEIVLKIHGYSCCISEMGQEEGKVDNVVDKEFC
jgi:hypothetical protein